MMETIIHTADNSNLIHLLDFSDCKRRKSSSVMM